MYMFQTVSPEYMEGTGEEGGCGGPRGISGGKVVGVMLWERLLGFILQQEHVFGVDHLWVP